VRNLLFFLAEPPTPVSAVEEALQRRVKFQAFNRASARIHFAGKYFFRDSALSHASLLRGIPTSEKPGAPLPPFFLKSLESPCYGEILPKIFMTNNLQVKI